MLQFVEKISVIDGAFVEAGGEKRADRHDAPLDDLSA
jgi:hypothetical protein